MAKKSESINTTSQVKEEKQTTKSALKKTAVKKTTTKKLNTEVIFQYAGKEIFSKELLEDAKKDFILIHGEETEIKDMKLYIKPEDNVAYYVVNETISGKVPLK